MMESVAFFAPTSPPLMGASSSVAPRFGQLVVHSAGSAGEIVE
jgi:hypothetical protein